MESKSKIETEKPEIYDGMQLRLLFSPEWTPLLKKGMIGIVRRFGSNGWEVRVGPFPFGFHFSSEHIGTMWEVLK